MEAILAEARKVADSAEVFQVLSEETSVQFEANRLKQLQYRQSTSVALRIIKNGRVGYATSTQAGNGSELVSNALETAQFGIHARYELPGPNKYGSILIYDESVSGVPVEKMVKLGQDMVAAVTGHTPGIMCEASVSRGKVSLRILNSQGGQAGYQKSFFSLGLEGNLINGTDMLFVGEGESSCRAISDSRVITDAITRQLDLARERAAVKSGLLPVIFTPNGVASALVMPLMAAFNGKTVLEGASPLGGKLGQAVFDKKFELCDDPTLEYRPASRPCDDECIPSQRTPLIEEGKVVNFLYDLQTAAMAGTRSTGNASRGRGLPTPAPTAFIIGPGQASFEEMVADVKEGLVVEQLIGAEQGNILGGDFSGNVLLGYRVENGRIVGRVKDTMVSGNVYQALKDIAAIGREAKWVGSSLYIPPIYCPALSVASKA